MGQRQVRRQLEELYKSRHAKFLRVSSAIVRDDQAALDVVQDAFAKALRGAGTFVAGDLEGWVWRIVVNEALASRRRRMLVTETADDLTAPEADGTDELGVRAWIAALPERQRLAVFLRYYADLDYRAIAAAIDVEVGTVSATLSQAHTALRRQLKEVGR